MKNKKLTCLSREEMVEAICCHLNQILRENLYEMDLNQEQLTCLEQQKEELRMYLKQAGTGDEKAKTYLISIIQESLIKLYDMDEKKIETTYFFSEEGCKKVSFQFEILLYLLEKEAGADAFEVLVERYGLLQNQKGKVPQITAEEIQKIYEKEKRRLSFAEQLELLSRNIYAYYKGLGVIDTIRDMHIDGVSGGVSGEDGNQESVWLFYKGRSVHLTFLSFESEKELERVARNCCRFQQPGELSKTKGYLVHEMADHARVVVVRPNFAEHWMFFIRKLDVTRKKKPEELYRQPGAEAVIQLLRFLVKGCQIFAITGMQGCGKTTLLMALVDAIAPEYPIRVLEQAFELHLREAYPERNIATFRETPEVDGQEGLEVQRKTDGAVTIIGEVVAPRVAAWMVESAQSGSLFTLFTHHARTTEGLLYSLRNSLMREGNFRSEELALEQVVHVIGFDVHLHMDRNGERYIERISEILPGEEKKKYRVRELIRYENGVYKKCGSLSEKRKRDMAKWMTREEREEFFEMDL
ncbi:MAG: ATPase, T2SS/T4P/T4SS family [Roseburia sp.]